MPKDIIDSGIVESVSCVYSDGKHNMCTDIVRWKDAYYIVFAAGSHHMHFDHVGVVLRSEDLKNWEKIYVTPYPARDTTLLALPDRLLMYYVYYDIPAGEGELQGSIESRVAATKDGLAWSEPQRVHEMQQNFWRPKAFGGGIYVASDYLDTEGIDVTEAGWYHGGGLAERRCVDLLFSEDGFSWRKVSTIVRGGGVTETEILFTSRGELWAFSRPRTFSRARAPYTEWQNTLAADMVGGPAMIEVNDKIYLGGRYYGLTKGKCRCANCGKWATTLWQYDEDDFRRLTFLPEPGHHDLSYPGFVIADDGTYMVYYSSHRHKIAFHNHHADIFLAKLKLK